MFDPVPTAAVFPGQGAHTKDMREFVAAERPDLLELATELAGEDPFARVGESTRFAQPAILCASLAGWDLLRDLRPVAVSGHSLGELSALAAAGVLEEQDAVALAVTRGRLMAEAGERAGGGTMLALLGATPAQARRLAEAHDVAVANDNAPGQVVLSGSKDRLEQVVLAARADRVRVLRLDVAGAFHSPQMAAARAGFAAALRQVPVHEPRIPVLHCATAQPFTDVRRELAEALTAPVRWRETMTALHDRGARHVVDVGPGDVLVKLVQRCLPDVTAARLEDARALA
ncbi:ACP S-malonyltransferase [Conexibacter sp. SYSU D00693]|uniref:ACP S-malonyltransferase n=1 Tax=Conexibacter sp. SYSU D00693 TaxID=2812560 RepID=UPI00196B087B|nr:ACP S-malonyltransferase [Conexibacter sp. SYSU D00693]